MRIFITVGLGWGDEGKGTVVDSLVRRYSAGLIVRYNGGCQAAHSVYSDTGTHHSFSQFGATFTPYTNTLLGGMMLVNPLTMMKEAEVLAIKGVKDPLSRVFIDERALMVTPYHRAVNRLKELARGAKRHGSCGHGVGETMAYAQDLPTDALRIGDMKRLAEFTGKLMAVRVRMLQIVNGLRTLPDTEETKRELSTFNYDVDKLFDHYADFYNRIGARIIDPYSVGRLFTNNKTLVFEGAQGVLLDEHYGFHPHTTWSTTTTRMAKLMLEEAEVTEKPTVIGITRSYSTRHGAGPFPTESEMMTQALADPNNPPNPWQEHLRSGALDLPLLKYALKATADVDYLAVTHMDKVTDTWPVCSSYEDFEPKYTGSLAGQERLGQQLGMVKPRYSYLTKASAGQLLEYSLGTPIGITSHGPGPADKQYCGAAALLTD